LYHTVADYSSQALVNTILARAFPDDPIVGEEDANDLRNDADPNAVLQRERIVQLATEALREEPVSEHGEEATWGLGSGFSYSPNDILDAIDRGNHPGGRHGRTYFFLLGDALLLKKPFVICIHAGMWTLDPIDGTKGFLRGGQYAVCLALIVDAQVQLGVIGCPNLPYDPTKPSGEVDHGCIFVAVRGQGAHQVRLFPFLFSQVNIDISYAMTSFPYPTQPHPRFHSPSLVLPLHHSRSSNPSKRHTLRIASTTASRACSG
jgi:3'(2'), 5'-bisphosphate nucleotidase